MAVITETVKRFIMDLFDDENMDTDVFIRNGELDMNAIFSHPVLKLNVLYCIVWNAIFSTYPSKYDFRDFMIRNRLKSNHDFNSVLQDILLLKIVAVDMNAVQSKLNALAPNLHDSDFHKTMILRKWHYRFHPVFPNPDDTEVTESMVHIYVKHIKQIPVLHSEADKPYPLISGNIDYHPNFKLDYGTKNERMQYMLHKDLNFCKKLASEGLIVYDDTTDMDKCRVLKEAFEITSVIPYESCKDVLAFVPKIAKVFINLSEHADLPRISPTQTLIEKDVAPFFSNGDIEITKTLLSRSIRFRRELPYIDFVNKFFAANSKRIATLHWDNSPKSNVVILVDNRKNTMSVISMLITALNLDASQWDFRVFTSRANIEFYNSYLGEFVEVIPFARLDNEKFSIETYNDILQSSSFWMMNNRYSKALIIQDDGVVVRRGAEEFLEWDYIGAPWLDVPDNSYLKERVNPEMVGNGGLSIRSIPAMIDICSRCEDEKHQLFYYNIIRVPEDVYFVKAMRDTYRIAPNRVASRFSTEEVMNKDSIGFHKLWMYNSPESVTEYFDGVPV
jgi:hypothetical protein